MGRLAITAEELLAYRFQNFLLKLKILEQYVFQLNWQIYFTFPLDGFG
jgi:hypothetical protein